eukprot:g3790.t1
MMSISANISSRRRMGQEQSCSIHFLEHVRLLPHIRPSLTVPLNLTDSPTSTFLSGLSDTHHHSILLFNFSTLIRSSTQ